MIKLFQLIDSIRFLSELAEKLVNAWLVYRARKIASNHSDIVRARAEIIRKIERARNERDSEGLIALNRALYLVDFFGVQYGNYTTSKN